ncbi:MAG TPA: sugar ABC transporter permease [Egibacteraceae bacterium]|nr:sugar ABC transporter permease [Egibacteraceae bacterium]
MNADTEAAPGAPASRVKVRRRPHTRSSYDRRWGLIFLSPWLIGFVLWYLLPMVASLAFSFFRFNLIRPEDARFIGLTNYARLLNDSAVVHSLLVTLKYALVALPLAVAVPLAFAWLLTAKSLWGKSFFRTLFYLPTIVPFVSAVFIWNGYMNTQTGWLNRMLGAARVPQPDWLNSTTWIYGALALIGLWGVGNAMLLFIAGMQGVPTELYEAAEVDGANSWHKFSKITVPMISPIIFYNVVLALIALFQYFLVPYVLKNGTGDPANSTLFYSMYFFKTVFTFNDMGYGATLAWVLFVIIMLVTGVVFRTARHWVHYEYQER